MLKTGRVARQILVQQRFDLALEVVVALAGARIVTFAFASRPLADADLVVQFGNALPVLRLHGDPRPRIMFVDFDVASGFSRTSRPTWRPALAGPPDRRGVRL